MTESVIEDSREESDRQIALPVRAFLLAILVVSLSPILIFALTPIFLHQDAGPNRVLHAIWSSSLAHVGLTGMFWLDRRYRQHMASEPRRYYLDPVILLVGSITVFWITGAIGSFVFYATFLVWLYFHYMKQNWGLLCLSARSLHCTRPTQWELSALYLGFLGGVLGTMTDFTGMNYRNELGIFAEGFSIPGQDALAILRQAGLVLVTVSAILGLGLATYRLVSGAPYFQCAMSAMVGLFFLPIYALDDGAMAIGCSHAFQYAIVMTILAADRSQGIRLFRLLGLVAVTCAYVAIYYGLREASWWGQWADTMAIAGTVVIMWHFMIDAGLWRLGQAFQRNAMRQSFAFLFR